MGKDKSGPIEFEDRGAEFPAKGSLYTTPEKIHFRALYDNGVELVCQTAQRRFGVRFEGDGRLDRPHLGQDRVPRPAP